MDLYTLQKMKKWQLWAAASIGIVVVVGMMVREFDVDALREMELSPAFFLGIGSAVVLFVLQNLMLTLRFQLLTGRRITLLQSFRVNVLCEFTSAVTPSVVGGSGLTFIYLNREGVTMGRSLFSMFGSLLADEAFLAVSSLVLYLMVPSGVLFCFSDELQSMDVVSEWLKGGMQVLFLGCIVAVAVWTIALYWLLLHSPHSLGWVLKWCCKVSFLRRFRQRVKKLSEDMVVASAESKQEGCTFWVRLMTYTSLAWMSRFAIVVAIIYAFRTPGSLLVVWIRQWVIWMVSILIPTPGGSGVAELMFRLYYSDFLPNASVAIVAALLWRAIFYYPYLIMGLMVLPKWMERNKAAKG